ncbi:MULTISPECIES: divergent PAP2 family protein [unclassified Acinetobacter]|uniref:divergent PAP2 family protein n=1 Tax=unclassified Acinetobacter TaxID=196816 RepID=UPI0029351792|nr:MULTISPECIES: divergent PAP2 family protein [unclassified Acinetobacter]WOE31301.1 divergent PAP2 family protein [Acinetobacter sp. SAAs470]WOE39497.1 divergent PAP2 family protein [Acinetobacter sp. SAAs474]
MNYYIYLITPFCAWLTAGILKFCINSIKTKKLAFTLIGYGGLPSNHSAIVSSTTALIALQQGIDTAAFAVAITFTFIVLLDANSLRQQVGKHAIAINKINSNSPQEIPLRERMGHTRLEIFAGIITGISVAYFLYILL